MDVRRLAIAVFSVLAAAMVAGPASAAFPGRNGLLAVAPLKGARRAARQPAASPERRICTGGPGCRSTRTPRWSPDGQALASPSSSGAGSRCMYSDGTCLDCHALPWPQAGVRHHDRDALSAVSAASCACTAATAWRRRQPCSEARIGRGLVGSRASGGGAQSAACSPAPITALRSLGPGTSPSWSPRGIRARRRAERLGRPCWASTHRSAEAGEGSAPAVVTGRKVDRLHRRGPPAQRRAGAGRSGPPCRACARKSRRLAADTRKRRRPASRRPARPRWSPPAPRS